MKHHTAIAWATNYLTSNGYILEHSYEIITETPWSTVARIKTAKEDIYLKQTPPSLFLEASIIQLLGSQLQVSVPIVIANNNNLHCFLMKDAGVSLRKYLKTKFQPNLLCEAIKEFTIFQRSSENHLNSFFSLEVPDWRLDKLPKLYDQLISQTEFLKTEGMKEEELQILHDLSTKVSQQCELLSQYKIPETLVQPDFNTNNTLYNPITKTMAFVDLGEIAITHPFFSLHNFLFQAVIHHEVKESDPLYHLLQDTFCEHWSEFATKHQLLKVFKLTKKLWPIYSALAHHRLMICVDLQAFKSFYTHRPNRLAEHLKEYIAAMK